MIATVISDMQSESFETQRLTIRCCRIEDASLLSALMSAEISRWVASWPFPLTSGQCEKILAANFSLAKEGKAFPGIIIEKNTETIRLQLQTMPAVVSNLDTGSVKIFKAMAMASKQRAAPLNSHSRN